MSNVAEQLPAGMIQRYSRLIRFATVGLMMTLAYALVATLFHASLPFAAAISSGLAYAVCSLGSYVGHRFFTFGKRPQRHGRKAFVVLGLSGYGLAILIPAMISDTLGWPTLASTMLTCIIIPLGNAWLMGRLVFGLPLLAKP